MISLRMEFKFLLDSTYFYVALPKVLVNRELRPLAVKIQCVALVIRIRKVKNVKESSKANPDC